MRAWLIFLGEDSGSTGQQQLVQPANLRVGDRLPLELRHPERWRREDVTRVIVGSEPTWADLVLVDEPLTIRREHARFYLNHALPDRSDFRAMKGCPVVINGQPHSPFEWINVHNGNEMQLSCWRFRYEWVA
jgi:hypothetical protein